MKLLSIVWFSISNLVNTNEHDINSANVLLLRKLYYLAPDFSVHISSAHTSPHFVI